jgi:hypothetical protein
VHVENKGERNGRVFSPNKKATSCATMEGHVDKQVWAEPVWTRVAARAKLLYPNGHFGTLGTYLTPVAKFEGRQCILLTLLR